MQYQGDDAILNYPGDLKQSKAVIYLSRGIHSLVRVMLIGVVLVLVYHQLIVLEPFLSH